jgi:ComF family protein
VAAATLYGGAIASAVSRFKYGASPWMARPLGIVLTGVSIETAPDLVIPVPLHRSRLAVRGYNQAGLLAAQVAKRRNIPIRYNVLARQIPSIPQAAKSRNERLRSMKDVFGLNRRADIGGKKILLVDDVVTTGATVDAASRILLDEGRAASVEVLCVARVVQG